jgi:autotransporter-associated beta strand protein
MRRGTSRAKRQALIGKLESACHRTIDVMRWALPVGAGALFFIQHAHAQAVYKPYSFNGAGTSYFTLTLTPDEKNAAIPALSAAQANDGTVWLTNTNGVSGSANIVSATSTLFQLPLSTSTVAFATNNNTPLTFTYPESTSYAEGTSSTTTYGGLEAISTTNNMSLSLVTGTGITQTNTDKDFSGPSELQIYANADWTIPPGDQFVPATNGTQFFNEVNYSFSLGGQVGAGGTASFSANLTFTFTPTTGSPIVSTLLLNPTPLVNKTKSAETINPQSNTFTGLVDLNFPNSLPYDTMTGSGNFAITGTITFQATNDDSPSYSMSPQAQIQLLPQVTPTTFVNPEGGSWTTANNWSNGAPGATSNTALFDGTVASSQTITVSGTQAAAGLIFASPNPINLAAGSGGGTLNLVNAATGTALVQVGVTPSGVSNTISVPLQLTSNTQISVNAGDTLALNSALSGTGELNFSGPGSVTLIQAGSAFAATQDSFTGPVVISGGAVILGTANTPASLGSGTVDDNGSLILQHSGTFPNQLSGNGLVDVPPGGSNVELTGNNSSFIGAVEIDSGTLQIGNSNALGTGAVTVNDGVLDLNGNNLTVAALNGFGTVDNVSAGGNVTLNVATSASSTFSGTIQNTTGSMSLTKSGLGTLDLQGNNVYVGTTTINAGTLALDATDGNAATNILPDQSLIMGGGTLEVIAGSAPVSQSEELTEIAAGPNTIQILGPVSNATLNLGSFIRPVSNQGALVEFVSATNGSLTPIQVTGATGATNPNALLGASEDNLAYSGYATFGQSDWAATTTVNDVTYVSPGSALAGFYTSPILSKGTYTLTPATATVEDNADINVAGLVQFTGPGTLTSIRFNTPTGGFSSTNGNTIDQLVISGSSGVLYNGGILVTPNVGANNVLITDSRTNSAQTRDLSAGNSGTAQDLVIWQNNTAGLLILNTGIADGASTPGNGLTKSGPGALVLNATSTYTGPTNLEGGVTEISADNALGGPGSTGALGTLAMNGGTLLAVNTLTLDNGSASTARNITIGDYGGAFVAATGQTLTIDGSITDAATGTGRLAIGSYAGGFSTAPLQSSASNTIVPGSTNGNGTVLLLGSLSGFTGPIVVANGELQVGNGTTSASLGSNPNVITDNGELVFDQPVRTTYSLSDAISGLGGLSQMGAGTVGLGGYNTYQGNTLIGPGSALSINSANALPAPGSLNETVNGTVMQVQTTGNVIDNGQLIFDLPAGANGLVSNLISGSGGITVSGSGSTINFPNLSSFGGAINLTSGALAITADSQLPRGGVLFNGGTLQLDNYTSTLSFNNQNVNLGAGAGTPAILSGNITGNSSLTFAGPGTLALNGNNTYSGVTSIQGGLLAISSSTALPSGGTITNAGALGIFANSNGNLSSNTGSFFVENAATFTNTGSISNLGEVFVDIGTELKVDGSYLQSGGETIVIGKLQMNGGPMNINGGTLLINPGSGVVDLTDNALALDYAGAASPIASVFAALQSGYSNGKWNGLGIVSSTVAALNASQSALIYSIGYADGADGITSLPSGEIEVLPTLAGDAKLQGNVVFGDFQLLSQYFGQPGSWDEGNFTYGSTVDFGDFQLLSQNFGHSSSALTAGELASINSFAAQFGEKMEPNGTLVSVPEPASATLLALSGIGLLWRRRSNRRT